MKILLSAYACQPDKGSEPYVGWTWTRAIARVVGEVHVITRAQNQAAIERGLAADPIPNACFHYFDLPKWAWLRKASPPGAQIHYYAWQHAVGRFACWLHERHTFNVVHHLTYAGFIYPPGIAAVPTRLVWGPIGFVETPAALRKGLHARAMVAEAAHSMAGRAVRLDPLYRRGLRKADVILRFPNCRCIDSAHAEVIPSGNIFIDTHALEPGRREAASAESINLISAFRMIFWKGADLAVEAIATLKRKGVEVRWTHLGDGPERSRCIDLARSLGIAGQIDFRGNVPRTEVLRLVSQADVFLHPSFRENFSTAVLEAMALECPVICLDWGEPAGMVTDDCGVKVAVDGSRTAIVAGLAEAIERLGDPALRRRMGKAGRQRVQDHFSLEALDRFVQRLYGSPVLSGAEAQA